MRVTPVFQYLRSSTKWVKLHGAEFRCAASTYRAFVISTAFSRLKGWQLAFMHQTGPLPKNGLRKKLLIQ
jgi:hypothetical protein